MARADEPRIYVRVTHAEWEAIDRAARVAGIGRGALLRQCGLRWGPLFAAELAAGRVRDAGKIRRRSGRDAG